VKRALPFFGSFLLLLAAVSCTLGTVITGFMFTVNSGALALLWFVCTLALVTLAGLWSGKGALLLIPPALAVFIWRLPEISEGAKSVVNLITSEYNKWLYIPILFAGSEASVYEITAFFATVGIVLAFLLYLAICMWRSSLLVVFFTVPLVFLTFVLNYLRPSVWFLIGLLAVYLTLLISNGLDKDIIPGKKRRGIFVAVVMTVVLLGIAYLTSTTGESKRDERINTLKSVFTEVSERTEFIRIKSGIGWPEVSGDEAWRFRTDRVGIADAGIRNISDRRLLEINASKAGTYYLRGYSMQYFDGRTWSVDSFSLLPDEDLATAMPAMILAEYNRINNDYRSQVNMIITNTGIDDSSDNTVYIPYYSFSDSWQNIGIRRYEDFEINFHYTQANILDIAGMIVKDSPIINSRLLTAYNKAVAGEFTMVNRNTARELRRLASEAGIDPDADRAVIAARVAAYISSSARYTLTPYVIPDDKDFTLYFLETSKQGYCIHFATAATLMLRALDVPARFTYGFAVTVPESDVGRTVYVTDRNAHAWVEVYYDDIGWLPLEVTPPAPGIGTGPSDGRPSGSIAAPVSSPSPSPSPSPANSDRNDAGEFDDMPPDWILEQLDEDRQSHRTDGQSESDPGSDPEQDPGELSRQGPGVPVIVFFAVIFAAVVVSVFDIRRKVRRARNGKRFLQEDPNAAVIHVWRYVSRFGRHIRLPVEMERLALKARFSQHIITENERGDMIDRAFRLADELYEHMSFFGRLWLKWGLVI